MLERKYRRKLKEDSNNCRANVPTKGYTVNGNRRRAAITTLGCRLNQAESLVLKERLEQAGYEFVSFEEPADLGIIHTCTVTREADAKCRKLIRGFIRRNPQAFTAVIGCYSQVDAEAIAGIDGVDLILGNRVKMDLPELVSLEKRAEPLILRERIGRDEFSQAFVEDEPFSHRANLKVQDGCDFVCSFCVIPVARGRARARDWENCLAEARSLIDRGAVELILTGVNIGTYQSGGRGILELVDALNEIDGLGRLRVSSIEPTTVPLALVERMADSSHRLQPFLHLPLQAGSDRVLQAMRRRYTKREYAEFVEEAFAICPDLCLGTDLLLGFPGETEADFAETEEFFLELPFAYGHVFPFSVRPYTAVAKKPELERLSPEMIRARCARMRRLSEMKRHAFYEARLGQVYPVLLEDPEETVWRGYTPNYIRVELPRTAGEADIRNQVFEVKLERIGGDVVVGEWLKP